MFYRNFRRTQYAAALNTVYERPVRFRRDIRHGRLTCRICAVTTDGLLHAYHYRMFISMLYSMRSSSKRIRFNQRDTRLNDWPQRENRLSPCARDCGLLKRLKCSRHARIIYAWKLRARAKEKTFCKKLKPPSKESKSDIDALFCDDTAA